MTQFVQTEAVLNQIGEVLVNLQAHPVEVDVAHGDRIVPEELRLFLAELRLLQGVPFGYLVPDAQLLPPESVRFFFLDRRWTDSLVQGALSVGTVNSSDRAELERLHAAVRDEVDEAERLVRVPGGEDLQEGPAGVISGMLLRSQAVSGWPGLHVRAYSEEVDDREIPGEVDPRRLKLMRLERLAPAVLLALFDGVPEVVHIEEPRQGIQFGVRPEAGTTIGAIVPTREFKEGGVESSGSHNVDVPFRPGSPGVIDLRELADELAGEVVELAASDSEFQPLADNRTLTSAEFAWQMIRFPYRQVFGDPAVAESVELDSVFKPTVAISDLRLTFKGHLDAN